MHYQREWRQTRRVSRPEAIMHPLPPVEERHHHAMTVIRQVHDEDVRWLLLDCVVNGSAALEYAARLAA